MIATRKAHIWLSRLKELRVQNGLTQGEVANVLHCSQVAYGMYELGKRKIPVEQLIALAKYYHVTLDYLTGICDDHDEKAKQRNF